LSPEAAPLADYIGDLIGSRIGRVFRGTPKVLGTTSQILHNNWKLYVENVKDTYHASLLHTFFTTFRLSRLTTKGGVAIAESGGNHASYTYGAANTSLALSIRCASDNYKFELTSNVVERRGQISGTWSEAAYKVSGQISGRLSGNHIAAVARGDNFTSDLAVTTTANRMMVTMTPKATYVIAVKMAFNRR